MVKLNSLGYSVDRNEYDNTNITTTSPSNGYKTSGRCTYYFIIYIGLSLHVNTLVKIGFIGSLDPLSKSIQYFPAFFGAAWFQYGPYPVESIALFIGGV